MTRSIRYPVMNGASRLLALVVGVLTLSAALPARAQYACTTNYCIRSQSLSVQTPPEWPAVAVEPCLRPIGALSPAASTGPMRRQS